MSDELKYVVFWSIILVTVFVIGFMAWWSYFIGNCEANGFTHAYCVAQFWN